MTPFKKKLVFVFLLLLPLFHLTWKLFTNQLGAQPSEEMNHELGQFTYRYLAINLIWGSLLALNWLPSHLRTYTFLRRHLGVVTFVYACLHLTFYALKEGDVPLAITQLFEKTYLIIGFTTWSILLVLALTSTNWAVRTMRKNWKRLHRLAYVALILATTHFYLIEKKDWTVTLPFLIPALALFGVRAFYALGIKRNAASRSATRASS